MGTGGLPPSPSAETLVGDAKVPAKDGLEVEVAEPAPSPSSKRKWIWAGVAAGLVAAVAIGVGVGVSVSKSSQSSTASSVSSGPPSWQEQDRLLLDPAVRPAAANVSALFPCPASRAGPIYTPRPGDPAWVTPDLIRRPNCSAQMVVSVNDYGMDTAKADNWFELSMAVAACRRAAVPCRLVAERGGTYRFSQERAVDFVNLTDFSLDLRAPPGQPETTLSFVRMVRISHLMHVVNCTRCEFRGFTVDWQWDVWPLASLVKMAAIREEGREIDLEFFQYGAPGGGSNGTAQRQASLPPFDPRKIAGYRSLHMVDPVRYNMALRGATEHFSINSNLERISPVPGTRIITLRFTRVLRPAFQLNATYLIRHFVYTGHAFTVALCVHCAFDEVNIVSAPGKAMTMKDDCEYMSFTRMKITRPEEPYALTGQPRPMSVTADGLFYEKTHGKILVADVEIGWNGDDCINNHDTIWGNYGLRRTGPSSILIPNQETAGPDVIGGSSDGGSGGSVPVQLPDDSRWPPAGTDPDFMPGDVVQLRNADFSNWFVGTLVRASFDRRVGWDLEFNSSFPTGGNISTTILFNDRRRAPKFLVRNLTCHDNRARGILLKVGESAVLGSTFRNIAMPGIMIHADAGTNEGTGVRDAVVADNVFDGCDVDWMFRQGCILVRAAGYGSSYTPVTDFFTDIRIERNVVRNTPGWAMSLANVGRSVVSGNRIEQPDPAVPEIDERARIWSDTAADLRIVDNVWARSPHPRVFSDNGGAPTEAQLVGRAPGLRGFEVSGNRVV
ncbi:hypothetical protein DFJ74DRAFT_25553 [Hyaloraphidium curvatum]|nr:hypothetical protein DFJ74DRAFT_25553 [Hyaloraphidium curvatum]